MRPRQYQNAAEKQKAYRERLKNRQTNLGSDAASLHKLMVDTFVADYHLAVQTWADDWYSWFQDILDEEEPSPSFAKLWDGLSHDARNQLFGGNQLKKQYKEFSKNNPKATAEEFVSWLLTYEKVTRTPVDDAEWLRRMVAQ